MIIMQQKVNTRYSVIPHLFFLTALSHGLYSCALGARLGRAKPKSCIGPCSQSYTALLWSKSTRHVSP